MKQLRLDFSDYTPEEQERDVERFKKLEKKYQPHVFLLKIDGVYAHLIFSEGRPFHKFHDGKNLFEAYYEIREQYPHHKIKCLMNKGLEDYLRTERKKEYSLNKIQRMIDFNQR